MFKIGRTAAQLEREKLQAEIQKEKSELRRKKLENRLKMSVKAGGRSGPAKNPKKPKRELDDDDDFLEDLVVESDPKKPKKPTTYANLKPGGFVTKAEDQKGRLEKRRAKQETKDDDDDDDDDDEETEQERLEREANELTSQLKKAERAEAQAREKEQKDRAKRYSQWIMGGRFLKQARAVTLVETKKRKKVDENGRHCQCGRGR